MQGWTQRKTSYLGIKMKQVRSNMLLAVSDDVIGSIPAFHRSALQFIDTTLNDQRRVSCCASQIIIWLQCGRDTEWLQSPSTHQFNRQPSTSQLSPCFSVRSPSTTPRPLPTAATACVSSRFPIHGVKDTYHHDDEVSF